MRPVDDGVVALVLPAQFDPAAAMERNVSGDIDVVLDPQAVEDEPFVRSALSLTYSQDLINDAGEVYFRVRSAVRASVSCARNIIRVHCIVCAAPQER